jgi:hypothetical protein
MLFRRVVVAAACAIVLMLGAVSAFAQAYPGGDRTPPGATQPPNGVLGNSFFRGNDGLVSTGADVLIIIVIAIAVIVVGIALVSASRRSRARGN